MRPTWRCKAISAPPAAPPDNNADRQSIGNVGQKAAAAVPKVAQVMLIATGRRSVLRSANFPAGIDRNTCVSANKAISTPTASALCPSRKASKGAARRMPVMQAWMNT